jgi:hypothetical protein
LEYLFIPREKEEFLHCHKVKREHSMFKELQESSMLTVLGIRDEAEAIGRGLKTMLRKFTFSKGNIELQNTCRHTRSDL